MAETKTNLKGAVAAMRVLDLYRQRDEIPWWHLRRRWKITREIDAVYLYFETVK